MTHDQMTEIGLLQLALSLHAQFSGAADREAESDVAEVRDFLAGRLRGWFRSPPYTARFDAAVRALVEIALEESEVLVSNVTVLNPDVQLRERSP